MDVILQITSGCTRARRAQTGRVQRSERPNVLKALFVREQHSSSQLSIYLSQVTVSREKRCSGTKQRQGPRGHVIAAWVKATSCQPGLSSDSGGGGGTTARVTSEELQ